MDSLQTDGRVLAWLVEVSTDYFATVTYRWATAAGTYGGNFYEGRILQVGNIQRSLGADHLPVASATQLALDNTDFGSDFLVANATMESFTLQARFRISLALSDPDVLVPTDGTQQPMLVINVGQFTCLDYPARGNDGQVTLTLADDAMHQLNDVLPPPALIDWLAVADATADPFDVDVSNTMANTRPLCDENSPAPLQFGIGALNTQYTGVPACTFVDRSTAPADFDAAFFGAGRRKAVYPIIILATRSTSAIQVDDARYLIGTYRKDVVMAPDYAGTSINLPSTVNIQGTLFPMWKAYKTATINITGPDGVSYAWKLLYIAIDIGAYSVFMNGLQVQLSGGVITNTTIPLAPEFASTTAVPYYGGAAPTGPLPLFNGMFAAFDFFSIVGSPGSQVTDVAGLSGSALYYAGQPASILQDLVQYYSTMGSAGVDTTSFTAARGIQSFREDVRGDISPGVARVGDAQYTLKFGTKAHGAWTVDRSGSVSAFGLGQLRQALKEICASSDVDLFVTYAGKVAILAQGADFNSSIGAGPGGLTWSSIPEERMKDIRESIPSQGQRWAPYNRVFVNSGSGQQLGPFDNKTAISTWKRILERTIQGKWWRRLQVQPQFFTPQGTSGVWGRRNLEAKVRGILSFTTDTSALNFDLGSYLTLSWTRGGNNTAYASALFRIESMTIRSSGEVDVTAVWMADLQSTSNYPYLLDNEALVIRASPGAATLTVTTGSLTISRSAGSFITDGVAKGDIIRVRDSSETALGFKRNRDLLVDSVTDATNVLLESSMSTDFGTAGAHVVAAADWSMLRGATTYPDSSSDPANYPNNGKMYGKVARTTGGFSDGSPGNKLLDG